MQHTLNNHVVIVFDELGERNFPAFAGQTASETFAIPARTFVKVFKVPFLTH